MAPQPDSCQKAVITYRTTYPLIVSRNIKLWPAANTAISNSCNHQSPT